jgi:hypothetical protein
VCVRARAGERRDRERERERERETRGTREAGTSFPSTSTLIVDEGSAGVAVIATNAVSGSASVAV